MTPLSTVVGFTMAQTGYFFARQQKVTMPDHVVKVIHFKGLVLVYK